jgi:peptidoglycan/LPS O-acetylase OafA/YrhL
MRRLSRAWTVEIEQMDRNVPMTTRALVLAGMVLSGIGLTDRSYGWTVMVGMGVLALSAGLLLARTHGVLREAAWMGIARTAPFLSGFLVYNLFESRSGWSRWWLLPAALIVGLAVYAAVGAMYESFEGRRR